MWEALIASLFSLLKEHFDHIIMRITTWCLSFILCWLYLPLSFKYGLEARPLPALPSYALVYLFYLTAATAFWQGFFIFLDIMGLIIEKIVKCKAIQPQANRVKVDKQQEK
ncbi:hypothetical protein Q7267_10620 [Glaesserella parasuis]|nr:hypothetical protein [Glaesserella parasuis]EQA13932.1 hypothetical protein HPSSW140_0258 [Glaesserella parasuis SW140]AWY45583.1 hypothetical protein B4U42_06200 [Glaesserella parasuis 29755]KEZ23150.1 hypothetical protein HS327_00755 [Glaesserella parasuis]MCT8645867.1 hypothetical protein [Glaesserella parasuis]MCT8694849.1 hypothetical protein [Glaesserella parasuis]